MEIFTEKAAIRNWSKTQKQTGKTIGFVPTMGYLHPGHLSLIQASKNQNDVTIVSIFVNPTQFAPNEDYAVYPRDEERDLELCKQEGVDAVFLPSNQEMYKKKHKTYVQVETLSKKLCGKSRPEHFRGVTTIVLKLFNIVLPDRAYFGQKDAQQVIIIKKMVEDLDLEVEIITCPIIREPDGLAMSSRNEYLNPAERKAATILYRSLQKAKEMFAKGETDAQKIKQEMIYFIKKEPLANIDYVALVETDNLEPVKELSPGNLIALAVKIGTTRLIDNCLLAKE